jgi:hypothetical protein
MLPGWDDVLTGEEAARLVATHVAPADPERALDRLLEGVAVDVREQPWRASFDDYFAARAAITEVPRALAGLLLRPLADGAYAIVDLIPAPMRRPFDRALGILLDVVASLPGQAIGAHLPDLAGPLPEAVDLGLAPYPQIRNACGETMLATWLKGHGVPIATGELDTQVPFFPGGASLQDEELRKRGFTLVSGPGTFDDIRAYLAHGYPVMVNVVWSQATTTARARCSSTATTPTASSRAFPRTPSSRTGSAAERRWWSPTPSATRGSTGCGRPGGSAATPRCRRGCRCRTSS